MLMLLASDWHHHGWFWVWPLVWFAWLFVFFLLARFFFFRRGPYWRHTGPPDARAILAERYARGEIGVEEYRERLGNLQQ